MFVIFVYILLLYTILPCHFVFLILLFHPPFLRNIRNHKENQRFANGGWSPENLRKLRSWGAKG